MDEHVHLISHPTDNKADFVNRLGKSFHFSATDQIYAGLKEISISCHFASEHLKSKDPENPLRLAVSCPYYSGEKFVEVLIPDAYYTPQSLVTLVKNFPIGMLCSTAFSAEDHQQEYQHMISANDCHETLGEL